MASGVIILGRSLEAILCAAVTVVCDGGRALSF